MLDEDALVQYADRGQTSGNLRSPNIDRAVYPLGLASVQIRCPDSDQVLARRSFEGRGDARSYIGKVVQRQLTGRDLRRLRSRRVRSLIIAATRIGILRLF